MTYHNDNHSDGLTCLVKLSYKREKAIKKMLGKNLAFHIAVGRKLLKMLKNDNVPA